MTAVVLVALSGGNVFKEPLCITLGDVLVGCAVPDADRDTDALWRETPRLGESHLVVVPAIETVSERSDQPSPGSGVLPTRGIGWCSWIGGAACFDLAKDVGAELCELAPKNLLGRQRLCLRANAREHSTPGDTVRQERRTRQRMWTTTRAARHREPLPTLAIRECLDVPHNIRNRTSWQPGRPAVPRPVGHQDSHAAVFNRRDLVGPPHPATRSSIQFDHRHAVDGAVQTEPEGAPLHADLVIHLHIQPHIQAPQYAPTVGCSGATDCWWRRGDLKVRHSMSRALSALAWLSLRPP